MSFFTDAGTKEAANLDQWQNGPINNLDPTQDQWVNGNLNGSQAHYSEGEYVPYRTTLSALDSDTKYWHEFQWDTTVGAGKHALDNLGSYDATFVPLPAGEVYPEPILGGPGVGDNKTVGSATVTAFDIPDDSRVLAGKDGVIGTSDDIDQGDGVMTLFGGTFDGYALRGADGNFGPIIYGNSATWTTDDLLLRPGGDALFNTADDELVAPGTDGRLGTGDDVVTTSGTSVSIINGADGVLGNTDDNNPYTYTGTYAGASTASLVPVITYNGSAEGNAILAWGGHIATRADWGDGNSAAAISGSSYHMRGLDFISQNDSTVSSGNQDRSLQNTAVTFPASITIEKQTDIDGSLQVFDFELTRPTNTIDVINGYVDLSGDRFIDGQDDGKFVDSLGEIFTIVDGEVTAYNSTGTVNSYFVNSSGLVVSGSTSGPVVTALNIAGTGTDTFSLTDNGSITFDNLVDFSSYTIKEIVPSNWDLTSINRVETDDINTGDVNDTIDPLASNSTNISLTETDQWSLTFNNKLIFVPNAAISILKYTNGSDGPSLNEGETVTWTYFVSNDGNVPLSDVVVSDDNGTPLVAGDNFFPTYVSGDAGNIGFLDPGEIWSYQYEGIADVGLYENIGKVTGDYAGKTEIATDVSSYVGIDVLPTLEVLKTASTNSVPETGADVDFTFTVKNTSAESVTITSLIDSDYGDLTLLSAAAAALIGTTLAPGASTASFTITQWVEGDFGGDDHINTFTAKAKDDEGNEASDTEDETITFSDVLPTLEVLKTASTNSVPETGADVDFTFTVKNTSAESVTITSLIDSDYGDLTLLSAAAAALIGTTLAPGASTASFTITQWVEGDFGGDDHINTFTAKAKDDEGNEASDTEDETITFSDVLPTLEVLKTASTNSVPETGADVDFTFTVKNTSAESVTITSLIDSDYGDLTLLSAAAAALIGTTLAPGASTASFTITQWVEGDFGGDDHINTFTAKAKDDEGNEASDTEDETITFSDVLPTLEVLKTASTNSVPETGADVDFTFTVKNTSAESVTITSLIDSDYGDLTLLSAAAAALIGTTLAPGASTASFTITQWVEGDFGGDDHINTFTAKAKDDEGNEASDTEDETITFSDVLPTLEVLKTASTNSVPETGADVDFTFTVKNTSAESVTITSLIDSDYGDLTLLSAAAAALIGTTLAPGASTASFTITQWVEGDFGGDDHINTFTAKAKDDEGNEASDTEDETITFSDVLPTLEVLKTASTNSVPETGADVDFTFTVKNTSAESVTITSLIDSDYGDLTLLSAAAAALIGTTLAPGASTASFTITQWVEGDFGGDDHINTFTAKAKDDEGNEASDTEDETITFSDVKPDISVIKLVDANGDGIFSDEEWTVAGNDRDVEYQFTITNNNAESVTLDSITDSKLVGADLLTAAIAAHGSAILAGNGDSVTFTYNTELDLVDGIDDPYINTVSAVASDNDGNSDTATDSAKINVLSPGYVTNSSLCDFGDVFDLIFTPDLKNWSASPQGVYKLSDSNPGQFYYNTFFTPEDVGDKDGVFEAGETLTLSIPYPFVTQGANPVHAYSSVTEHEPGCFVPGTEIFNGGSSMAFTLNQYTDTNGDGKIGYGDNYTMTVNLDQLPDGFVYLNAHFDYGLEKENGWKRSGENALNDPVINPGLSGVNIMEPTSHVFSSSIIGSTDSIANNNEFKNPKGFGGLVEIKVSDVNNDGDYLDSVDVTEAVVGAKVELWNGTGTTKLDTAYTDINGWYFMPNFIHKGSIATYQVKLVADTNATDNVTYAGETKSTIVGKGDKFGEGYFQVVDTTGGPGYTALVLDGDPLLNSHAPTLFDENSAALQQVVDNAIVYWAEHGANADQLALLSGTTIKISDLGNISDGKTLAMWDGSGITFDDDAAGYGWSIGLGNVNPNRVDGLSALVHEYGHVLGYEHDVLGENLAVGERDLPEIELIGATHTLEMFV